jgi:transposase
VSKERRLSEERVVTMVRQGARVSDERDAPEAAGQAVPVGSEVLERVQRRRFTAAYKLRVLREADACREPGEIGALLRREGLYSSHLTTWRRARDEGSLHALAPKKRGRKPKQADPLQAENARLQREIARLEDRLQRAELVIDVQKKVAALLGIPLKTLPNDGSDS